MAGPIDLTEEQFLKLPECVINYPHGNAPKKTRFLKRGRNTVTIVFRFKVEIPFFSMNYPVTSCYIDGKQLEYNKYISNPKNPF